MPRGSKPGERRGGRKQGSLNKAHQTAIEIMQRLGCNPIEAMVHIAQGKTTPVALKAKMFSELAKYGYPQLKAVEHSGEGGGPIQTAITVRFVGGDS